MVRHLMNSAFFTIFCLFLALGVICHPVDAFHSAQRGLQTWWEIVFPSLLPFFIISELLMNLGFVSFLGTLMEPAMRPLFNLPGRSGFIIAVSYLSGFPLCAILTNRLRQEKFCTREEGERLLAFTSNASPLFMLGAVSIGMYNNPTLGPLIALIHYLSNLICGIILRLFSPLPSVATATSKKNIFASALKSFASSSQLKAKGFGKILGETVHNASTTLLTIGGFITFFSVLIGIIQAAGLFSRLLYLLAPIIGLLNLDAHLVQGLLYGFFEITIGIKETSQSTCSIFTQLLVIEMLLAWNGLAIQAQVTGMVIDSDLRLTPYFYTRLLQIPIASLITFLVFCLPIERWLSLAVFASNKGWGWHPIAWGGMISLLSIAFFLCYSLGMCLIDSIRRKVIIIR